MSKPNRYPPAAATGSRTPDITGRMPPEPEQPRNEVPERARVAYAIHRDASGWVLREVTLPESVLRQYITKEHPGDMFGMVSARVQTMLEQHCIGGERG